MHAHSMHMEMTALLEYNDTNMNVCCTGACAHLPDNARMLEFNSLYYSSSIL